MVSSVPTLTVPRLNCTPAIPEVSLAVAERVIGTPTCTELFETSTETLGGVVSTTVEPESHNVGYNVQFTLNG